MSDHSFPHELERAAKKWKGYCTSFAQLRRSNGRIKIRMQAPQIMWEFVGSVEFGRDPMGILFYAAQSDFEIHEAEYQVTYHSASDQVTTVLIDFYEKDEDNDSTSSFARWVSRVDTKVYTLPDLPRSNRRGSGQWNSFKALTSQAKIFRISGSSQVHLEFGPILKQVSFHTVSNGGRNSKAMSEHGTMIAHDLSRLDGSTSVNYGSDRIVFFRDSRGRTGNDKEFIALFLPNSPVALINDEGTVRAKWSLYHSND